MNVYHTDLILNLGEEYGLVCTEAIKKKYRKDLLKKLAKSRKDIIEISFK